MILGDEMARKTSGTSRDGFSKVVKDALARRVASRCSNPDCRAVTSGPKLQSSGAVNVGVAAHITAASPGGPRYDPALTPVERASEHNGIWLCQNCGKLIDSDVLRYTAPALRQWKNEAERKTLKMLEAGVGESNDSLLLDSPRLDSSESLLAFANTAIARIGRDAEIRELKEFLQADQVFSWWLWTGSAGAGKSRLAIELCRAVAGEWHAGFLREDFQSALRSLQPTRPTLVVVDYAAQCSEWLSEELFRLSRRVLSAPVRVLVLERQAAGTWWDTLQRTHRMEESFHVQASQYGLPRELGGLSRPDIRRLIKAVATYAGAGLSSTNVEDIADHAEKIDAERRPLFALVATMDWLDGNGVSGDRDAALRRLIARVDGQTAESVGGFPQARRVRNVRTLATALGGVSADEYARLLLTLSPPAGLLLDVYDDFLAVPLDDLLDGVRPDILGELYVLDRLAATGTERAAAVGLLQLAWRADQQAYQAFVERAAGDHKEHEQLVHLLDAGDWIESPVSCARMVVDTVPLLQRSDHPALEWIFSRFDTLRESISGQSIDELAVTARFRFANLVLNEGDARRANELFTKALADCDPCWSVRSGILNNRGITRLDIGDREAAMADFTAVIEDSFAEDEARACALNNRADLHDEDGNVLSAVADRSAVLGLAETTYNRRYIALARRARALWSSGDRAGAHRDIESILATSDIVMEQKMAARLQRAEWAAGSGSPSEARPDLEAVIASARNFDSVERRARELLSTSMGDS
ncbi:hypothetical protein ACIQGO_01345 [Streptomyces shenzhenensis]|uniref:hypothetical protein n=1 Tax=Streptomyces shenzhenensis TaxID=943815 RepID=UPI0037F238AB